MIRTTMAALALATAIAAPGLAAPEDFHWQGTVASGATVEIKGVNGGITATGGSGAVEVVAVKKGRRSDPAQVKVEVVEHAGGVTICAVYPSASADRPNRCAPGKEARLGAKDNDVSVEFRVKVPAGVRLAAQTVNGSVSASGLSADASAETVNGGVDVESTGTARATTVNGGITARLGRADWDGVLKLSTVNGAIELTAPEGLSADVKATTVNGTIDTDFPVSVTGRVSRRSLTGTVGSGGRQLELTTVNGSIALRRAAPRK